MVYVDKERNQAPSGDIYGDGNNVIRPGKAETKIVGSH
jgi:hypothetical protein